MAEMLQKRQRSRGERVYGERKYVYACLELLMIAVQAKEPAPKPTTTLEQVDMIRTSTKNDSSIDLGNFRTYGGFDWASKSYVSQQPPSREQQRSLHVKQNPSKKTQISTTARSYKSN